MPELLPLPIPIAGERGPVFVAQPRFQASPVIRVDFAQGETDVFIKHGLGRVPLGYIVVGREKLPSEDVITVYNGSVPASLTDLVLRASGPGVAFVLVL